LSCIQTQIWARKFSTENALVSQKQVEIGLVLISGYDKQFSTKHAFDSHKQVEIGFVLVLGYGKQASMRSAYQSSDLEQSWHNVACMVYYFLELTLIFYIFDDFNFMISCYTFVYNVSNTYNVSL